MRAAGVLLVLLVHQVERGAALVLLARIVMLNLGLQNIGLLQVPHILRLKSNHLTVESLLAQVCEFVLLFVELLSANSLVRYREVLVEALTF